MQLIITNPLVKSQVISKTFFIVLSILVFRKYECCFLLIFSRRKTFKRSLVVWEIGAKANKNAEYHLGQLSIDCIINLWNMPCVIYYGLSKINIFDAAGILN